MHLINHIQTLQEQLKSQVSDLIGEHGLTLTSLPMILSLYRAPLQHLRTKVYTYPFHQKEEEIQFFKEEKPTLLSGWYYYQELLQLTRAASYQTTPDLKPLYDQKLIGMKSYEQRHHTFLAYCIRGDNHLDTYYFTREYHGEDLILDHRFTTGYDLILARFLAHELLKEHIQQKLTSNRTNSEALITSTLTWTGKKTDLIELLFALQCSGSINGGQATVKQIARQLEALFSIELGNYYHILGKIRARKSPAIFIDALKTHLTEKLETMDL
ncbi:RteC domain-containing protein [Fulvivirga maritima]|uniref:RteC domain-containing protein n=1 Tax=Fulvivirga maritima TaxID=2904247 RepID=UPI001F30B582|nr:RteC domain-containing protein [Fulvivirga maritima]UII29078.1 RteC domain-containing protein [Fulvivirga maritima]